MTAKEKENSTSRPTHESTDGLGEARVSVSSRAKNSAGSGGARECAVDRHGAGAVWQRRIPARSRIGGIRR